MIGGDPIIYKIIFRVKTFGYDSLLTTIRVHEEDTNIGQKSLKTDFTFTPNQCHVIWLTPHMKGVAPHLYAGYYPPT